jgi:ribosome maturation protein SDO1
MVNVDDAFQVSYKREGEEFQVLVDFDELQKFKKKSNEISVHDVLADSHIYKDQKKGELASQIALDKVFANKEEDEIFKEILLKGECQIPTAFLNKLREEKREQIINYLAQNAVNANGARYSQTVIRDAINKLSFTVNPNQDAMYQVDDILKLLKKEMPIKIETSVLEIAVPPQYMSAFFGPFRKMGTVTKEYYDDQGQLRLHLEVTSGAKEDVIEYVKKHSNNEASYHVSKVN